MAGTKAGTLRQHVDGARSFSYEKGYGGAPLSLAMPVSDRTYAKRVVDAYLMGLLPDDGQVRRLVGMEFGVSSNNPLAMLACRGLDCAGAVQFLPEEGEHSYKSEQSPRYHAAEVARARAA
jgi:serine/threonine-protein kinase HipA